MSIVDCEGLIVGIPVAQIFDIRQSTIDIRLYCNSTVHNRHSSLLPSTNTLIPESTPVYPITPAATLLL